MELSIRYSETAPTPEQYNFFRTSVGWKPMEPNASARGLSNSLYSIVAHEGDELAGMARIVGDGGVYFYIQDVIVLPQYQKNGIGTELMVKLMEFIDKNVVRGSNVLLSAAPGVAPFYESFGFLPRQSNAPGMWLDWDRFTRQSN